MKRAMGITSTRRNLVRRERERKKPPSFNLERQSQRNPAVRGKADTSLWPLDLPVNSSGDPDIPDAQIPLLSKTIDVLTFKGWGWINTFLEFLKNLCKVFFFKL
jgi:hypothetical protein